MRAVVLMDLYGTLVEPDWGKLLDGRAALARRAGVAPEVAHRAWDSTHAARMTGGFGSLAGDLGAVFAAVSERSSTVSAGLLEELARDEEDNWRRGVRPYGDAVPALDLLRSSGKRIAIVTNASAEAAGVIDALGFNSRVDAVFASCHVGLLKPALLEVALDGLGAHPSDATLVDDEPEQLDRAAELGIDTVLVRRAGTRAGGPGDSGPHRVVTDLRQLASYAGHAEPARRR